MTPKSARLESTRRDETSGRYGIFECPTCGSIALALGRDDPALSCHDQPMAPITGPEMRVRPPDVTDVLLQAFGLPKAGSAIRRYIHEEGPHSARKVADVFGYDRSTVSRYLNTLVDLDFLQRTQLNREAGGVTNVYHANDPERVRRRSLIGFFTWAGRAGERIEAVIEEMQDRSGDGPDRNLPEVYWV